MLKRSKAAPRSQRAAPGPGDHRRAYTVCSAAHAHPRTPTPQVFWDITYFVTGFVRRLPSWSTLILRPLGSPRSSSRASCSTSARSARRNRARARTRGSALARRSSRPTRRGLSLPPWSSATWESSSTSRMGNRYQGRRT